MRSLDLANLAAALRDDPAAAVVRQAAEILTAMAEEAAEAEAQPVPSGLRPPQRRAAAEVRVAA